MQRQTRWWIAFLAILGILASSSSMLVDEPNRADIGVGRTEIMAVTVDPSVYTFVHSGDRVVVMVVNTKGDNGPTCKIVLEDVLFWGWNAPREKHPTVANLVVCPSRQGS